MIQNISGDTLTDANRKVVDATHNFLRKRGGRSLFFVCTKKEARNRFYYTIKNIEKVLNLSYFYKFIKKFGHYNNSFIEFSLGNPNKNLVIEVENFINPRNAGPQERNVESKLVLGKGKKIPTGLNLNKISYNKPLMSLIRTFCMEFHKTLVADFFNELATYKVDNSLRDSKRFAVDVWITKFCDRVKLDDVVQFLVDWKAFHKKDYNQQIYKHSVFLEPKGESLCFWFELCVEKPTVSTSDKRESVVTYKNIGKVH